MTYDSLTARTNGSPLPKRHARRAVMGTRGTLLHCHPLNLRDGLRGSSQSNARRLRSEPIGTASTGRTGKSPTSLCPLATNWARVAQSQSPSTSPSPGSKAAPLMSYAAVAKLANNKSPLRPFPPPKCPIAADLAKIKLNGSRAGNRNGNGRKDTGSIRRPAASLDSTKTTKGAKIVKPGYSTPRRASTRQQELTAEDDGALLIDNELPMPDISKVELAEVTIPIELHRSSMKSIEIEPVEMESGTITRSSSPTAARLETPMKACIGNVSPFDKITPSKQCYPTFAGTDKTTPSTCGFYSPAPGAASRLGFDQSPFFPKTQADYDLVTDTTDAERAMRNYRRTHSTPTSTFLRPPWLAPEVGHLRRSRWEIQSETPNIMFKELDGPMQSLLSYIDKPET